MRKLRPFAQGVLIFSLLGVPSGSAARADTDAASCPRSAAEWDHWKSRTLSTLGLGPDILAKAAPLLSCQSTPEFQRLLQNSDFRACIDPLLRIANGTRGKSPMEFFNGDAMLSMDRASYYDPTRLPDPAMYDLNPKLMAPEVVQALTRPVKSPAAPGDPDDSSELTGTFTALAREIPGLQARLIDSPIQPPNIQGRKTVVISIPGQAFDQYIHVVRTPQGNTNGLMLVIQKQDPRTGAPLNPPVSFFKEIDFPGQQPEPHGSPSPSPRSRAPLNACVSCHRTGAIVPVPTGSAPAVYLSGDKPRAGSPDPLFAHIRATRNAVPFALRSELLGPALGEIDPPSRTDSFIRKCMGNGANGGLPVRAEQMQKIKDAMNCRSCHDGHAVSELRFPLGDLMVARTLFDHVLKKGVMPPGSGDSNRSSFLEPGLRDALRRCLLAEYYGGMSGAIPIEINPNGPPDPRTLLDLKSFPPGTLLRSYLEPACVQAPRVAPVRGGGETAPAHPAAPAE